MREVRRRWLTTGAAAAVVLTTTAAQAQTIINLSAGGADKSYVGAAGSRAGASLDQGAVGGTDSRRELIIGAPGGTTGRVYVLLGGPDHASGALDSRAEIIITGPASFGAATAAGNVVTPEGTFPRDLVVAAPDANGLRGVVYVFDGFLTNQQLTQANARLTITGAPGDRLGAALATADLDNNGYRELIIGAPGNDRIYVVYGGPALGSRTLPEGADTIVQGHPSNNAGIGEVLVAGPVTPDSIYDLAIGEPGANMVYLIAGRDRVLLPARIDLPFGQGLPATLPNGIAAAYAGVDPGDRAGSSLRTVNLDGRGGLDLLVGAPGADGRTNSAPDAGELYVLWNEQTATSSSLANAGVIFFGGQATQGLGSIVATGDVNRDTPNDLVFGLRYGQGGEARVYYGRERSDIGVQVGNSRVVDLSLGGQEDRIIINDATPAPITALAVFEVTGEGARDIVLSVPDSASGAGTVFLTISPKMVPSRFSAAFSLKEGESGAVRVDVRNPSAITLPWRVATPSSSPWVTANPSSGSSNSAVTQGFNVNVNGSTLGVGTHSAVLQLASTSRDLTMAIDLSVTVSVQQTRYLQIESPANGATLSQPFTITGYAIDKAATTGTGVDRVDVYAVPVSGGARRFLGTATYGEPRPAVGSAHGAAFTNSGFSLTVSNGPGGNYRLVGEAHSPATDTVWSKLDSAPVVTIRGVPPATDFNGDGLIDIVWHNPTTRAVVYWSMSGYDMSVGGALGPGTLPAGRWEVRTTADMNRDGRPDLVLQEVDTGELAVWVMNGTALTETRPLPRLSDPAWRVMASADLNADGHADLIFQHWTMGYVAAWLMNGTTQSQGLLMSPSRVSDLNWRIVGAGDVSGDGKPDLVWQKLDTGLLTSWIMDGVTMVSPGPFSTSGPSDANWQARALMDINADGKLDLVWQHVTLGYVAAWLLDGRTFLDARLLNPGQVSTSWRISGPR